MKKLLVTFGLSALATAGFAQGTINFVNGGTTAFHTNATAPNLIYSAGTAGNTAPGVGGFHYEVITAPSTTATVDASLQGLLGGSWSDTALMGSSTAFATGGRMTGGSGVVVQHWVGGAAAQSFIVVGWSANEGATWGEVAAKLAGATFNGGTWRGGTLVPGGFLGASTIQAATAGGGVFPNFSLFGAGGSAQGTPITTPTDLFVVDAVPEPGTFALAGLGAAALLIFRRRK